MHLPHRSLIAPLALIAASVCLLAPAASASALPDRVKVGPDLYLQSADAATGGVDRQRSGRAQPPSSTPALGGRIVGGVPTTIASYPWQAAIAYNDALFLGTGFQRQFCGGTLVAPNVVISAAHCFYENEAPPGVFGAPQNFEIFTGRTTLSTSEGQGIEFSDYYYFTDTSGMPLFNPVTFDYDAIFVVLASSSSSPPIKVAGADEAATWAPGRRAWISGWGDTAAGAGDYQDTLRAAQVQIIGDDVCSNPGSYGTDFHPALMFCAGVPAGGVDSCQGDSGGPIVVPGVGGSARATGSWRLVGDTSWGIGCAAPQYPGIYGRIAGGTPMGDGLQAAIQSVTGQNVYGSGAQPAEPPQVVIDKAPKNKVKTKKKRVKVRYRFSSSDPGADFACRRDKKPPAPCTSPYTQRVKKGKHKVTIVATNFLGETGAAATDKFKVKRKKEKRRRG
jgi:Trypsin